MALNFGRKSRISKKASESELFPNDIVVTLLPINSEKKKGSKKIQFNKYAMEQMNLLAVDKVTGAESNSDISFVDERDGEKMNFFLFINNGPITYKDKDGIEHEIKVLSSRITKSDNAVATQPWYDAISEHYELDNTVPNYFKLTPVNRTETSAYLYQLERIDMNKFTSPEQAISTNADEIVNALNHEMEELPIVTH